MKALFEGKKMVIFELDNVLFPERDYVLQVYYLFAQFIEYATLKEAKPILDFMQQAYEREGADEIFNKTARKFQIEAQYERNFNLLHQNARLPLKLLLYQKILMLLQNLFAEGKLIYLVTAGNIAQQLNKIKQMEWHGLDKHIKVFFLEEFGGTKADLFLTLMHEQNLSKDDVLVVGESKNDEEQAKLANLSYIVSSNIYKT